MKKSIFLVLVALTISTVSAQQISLYDKDREAIAYIDYDKDAAIFMWDGTPVAFIEKKGEDLCVFGYNGSFLGWYEDGIIYDEDRIVGAKKGAIKFMIPKYERIKGPQKLLPIRPITIYVPIKPIFFKDSWSSTSLTEFLYSGKK